MLPALTLRFESDKFRARLRSETPSRKLPSPDVKQQCVGRRRFNVVPVIVLVYGPSTAKGSLQGLVVYGGDLPGAEIPRAARYC